MWMTTAARRLAPLVAGAVLSVTIGLGVSAPRASAVSVPDAPAIVRNAAGGDQTATVSWRVPADGGSPITGYVVTPYIGYVPLAPRLFAATSTTRTLTGLTNGTTYRFRVQAVNVLGTSGASAISNPVLPLQPDGKAMWHANADVDRDLGDQTLFMAKETESLPATRLSIVDDPLGSNGKVYRAHLTADDVDNGDNRAEWSEAFLGDGETERSLWGEDAPGTTELWIGWRSLFGSDVLIDRGHDNDGNYMQMKGDSDCGGPAVGMTVKYGRLTIRSEQYLTATDGVAWNGPLMSTLLDDQWHDVLMHVNFAKDQTGYVEIWLDGVSQRMTNGRYRINFPTVCPDDEQVYPKFGVYGMDEGIGSGPSHWVESPRIATTAPSAVPR
jgi:hypothetical protein